jgi:hypothetical protein
VSFEILQKLFFFSKCKDNEILCKDFKL